MACRECNLASGFPEKYRSWILCCRCRGIGEVIKVKNDQEIAVKCQHCKGTGVCAKKIN